MSDAPAPTAPGEHAVLGSLVGREAELAQFDRAVRRVLEGSESVVLRVDGPVGIGKSQMLSAAREVFEQHQPRGEERVLRGTADGESARDAFGVVRSMLVRRAAYGASRRGWPPLDADKDHPDRSAAVRRLVEDALGGRPDVEGTILRVRELMGLRPASGDTTEDGDEGIDPRLRQDRLRVALTSMLQGLTASGPMLWTIDDAHASDAASMALIGSVLEDAQNPVLVVIGVDPERLEHEPAPLDEHVDAVLVLQGLAGFEVARLSRLLLDEPLDDATARELAARTDGNPLFVEQILREAGERSHRAPLERGEIPSNVDHAIRARLAHFPSALQRLCAAASVFDRKFTRAEIEAIESDVTEEELERLVDVGILSARRRRTRSAEFAFRSRLVRDVAYEGLGADDRRALHHRLARWLRDAEGDPEEIGRHFERAGEPDSAAESFAQAVITVARQGDGARVVEISDRALELGVPRALAFAVWLERGDALQYLGRMDAARAALERAAEVAVDVRDAARALVTLAEMWWRRGDPSRALHQAEEAEARLRDTAWSELLALALGRKAMALAALAHHDDAQRAFDEAVSLIPIEAKQLRALSAGWRGQLAHLVGDLQVIHDAFSEAARLYTEAGDVRRAASAAANLAEVNIRLGAYVSAEEDLRKALAKARAVGHRPIQGYAWANLGVALQRQGRFREATVALAEARRHAEANDDRRLRLGVDLYRVRLEFERLQKDSAARLLPHDWVTASPWIRAEVPSAAWAPLENETFRLMVIQAERVAKAADEHQLVQFAISASSLAARGYLALGQLDEAERWARQAMSRLEAIDGRFAEYDAEVFLTLADILEATGRLEEATEVLHRGRRRIQGLADTFTIASFRSQYLFQVEDNARLIREAEVMSQHSGST